MYFMSDLQALHVTRNVIPGKLGVDLHLHRVQIPLVCILFVSIVTAADHMLSEKSQRAQNGTAKRIAPVVNIS